MNKLKNILIVFVILGAILACAYAGFRLAFRGTILPNTRIGDTNVTGLPKETAESLLIQYFERNPNKVVLSLKGKELAEINSIQVKRDFAWAAEQAMSVGRNGNLYVQVEESINSLLYGRQINIPVLYNKEELNDLIDSLSDKQNHKPKAPSLSVTAGNISLVPGEDGVEIQKDKLEKLINESLVKPGKQIVEIPTMEVSMKENERLVATAIETLQKWGDKHLFLRYQEFQTQLTKNQMVGLFGLQNEPLNNTSFEELVGQVKNQVETEPKDAVFVFENNKVNQFKPEIVGTTIDISALKNKLTSALLAGEETTVEIPMILTYPKIKVGDINDLGIKELLGTGKSTFHHSIPGRVFNVNLAASRVNGTLVAPGEEFSFNKAVGDISKATGYQQAYIISEGRTVLGDGGGVCQVSTTTFRAALNAGFPITERKAHAYRVGYYEQDSGPGVDATVFYPSADLKFLNDTGHYILIQETVDVKNYSMRVDIYGTSDGRKATVSKPVISKQTPPPPTLYVDDPTLPLGKTKQIDWSAWGAKVSFDYKVERNGESIYEKTFYSNYQPWQAIFMKGTGSLAMN